MTYVISYDLGTTGVKTCLFSIEDKIHLVADTSEGYGLYVKESGVAEQHPDEWWEAMCVTTPRVLEEAGISGNDVAGISFCSQMQGLVLVDEAGNAVRPAMSYMDQRAKEEIKEGIAYGIQVAGGNFSKVLKSLRINNAVSTSVKDPIWKYKWVEKNEPEIFKKIKYWLDVKEYIIARCTGRFCMTTDSAYATLLYDTRSGHEGWSNALCDMYGIKREHLPELIRVWDEAGKLGEAQAKELGLAAGTPVFGGGGDASLIGVGAGCTKTGQTHVYSGTSGWVSTIVDKQTVDINYMIASIVGAIDHKYNYFAEMETAGKCLEWVKDHLALDEIDIYLEKKDITEDENHEEVYKSLYDYMTKVIKRSQPGSNGVIFTPWLHGNRCPFEDSNASGMFFNIKLETGKTEMIRSVVEGVCMHIRWMLECQDKRIKTSEVLRFVGGGALSDETCQILADVCQRPVETVEHPQDVGAVGAAAVCAVGLGLIDSVERLGEFIEISARYEPRSEYKEVYDRNFAVFKKLYQSNKQNFAALNS